MSGGMIATLSLLVMLALIWGGMHVAIVLATVSFVGVWMLLGADWDAMESASRLLAQAGYDAIASHIFGVIPLFVFTGFLVAYSDVGKDAYEVANQVLRRVRGGLGHATVASNAVFAAITGISIASAAVFTRVAVPEMLRFGYSERFAVGVVAGSSVLGMLIPPSLLMILYGFLTNTSVGDLFTAGIIPGILLALIYSIGIILMATFSPKMVYKGGIYRKLEAAELMSVMTLIRKIVPVILLIAAILGGLYAGLFTATEAGATGAAVALILAVIRRKLTWRSFWAILTETGQVTVSVSFLIICATIYTRMLTLSGLPQALLEIMNQAGVGEIVFLLVYVIVIMLLGTIIDSSSIILIMLPLMMPIATTLEMNLVWLGVVTVIAVETGLLTPPFGLSAYVIKSTLDQESKISLGDIFIGALPFLCLMVITLILVIMFPTLSLFLISK